MTTNKYATLLGTIARAKRNDCQKVVMRVTLVEELLLQLSNAEKRIAELAAENGQMLCLLTDISDNHEEYVNQDEYLYAAVPMNYVSEINAYVSRDVEAENPFKETDAFLAEVRANAIKSALNDCSECLDRDCIMESNGISYEDAALREAGAMALHDALLRQERAV